MAYTTIDAPTNFFDTLTYTGDGNTNQEVNGLNFTPSYIWIKGRNTAHPHTNIDSVRGGNKYLKANETAAEQTDPTYGWIDSFDSDGFTTQIGSNSTPWNVNKNGETYVAWCWKTGTSFSNDASATGVGDIDSTGSVNTDAGFSIVSYTGNGTSGTEVAHGLGSTPDLYITKSSSYAYGWGVYHKDIANDKGLFLNGTDAQLTGTGFRNSTAPTSSVFTLGGGSQPYRYTSNKSGETYIGYFFNEVKGYSKFGSYSGNGNADGTFVYTGFRPAFTILKKSSSSGNRWVINDSKRSPSNVVNKSLFADSNSADSTTSQEIDYLSNGFKLRTTSSNHNTSGHTYIYAAFAESSFVNSSGVPTNAR